MTVLCPWAEKGKQLFRVCTFCRLVSHYCDSVVYVSIELCDCVVHTVFSFVGCNHGDASCNTALGTFVRVCQCGVQCVGRSGWCLVAAVAVTQ